MTHEGCAARRNVSILLINFPGHRVRPLRSSLLPSGLTWLALLLALGHAVLATLAMREKSTTADELAHVTGGYTFNHWHDYRLHAAHGLIMAIVGAAITAPTERGDRMLSTMINRHALQMIDLDTLALIEAA